MPLIACPDCKRPVSDAAPACIHCGRPAAFIVETPDGHRYAGGLCERCGIGQSTAELHEWPCPGDVRVPMRIEETQGPTAPKVSTRSTFDGPGSLHRGPPTAASRPWEELSQEQQRRAIDRIRADCVEWAAQYGIPPEELKRVEHHVADAITEKKARTGDPVLSTEEVGRAVDRYQTARRAERKVAASAQPNDTAPPGAAGTTQSMGQPASVGADQHDQRGEEGAVGCLTMIFIVPALIAGGLFLAEPSRGGFGLYLTVGLGLSWAWLAGVLWMRDNRPSTPWLVQGMFWGALAAAVTSGIAFAIIGAFVLEEGLTLFSVGEAVERARTGRQMRAFLFVAMVPLIGLLLTGLAVLVAAGEARTAWRALRARPW